MITPLLHKKKNFEFLSSTIDSLAYWYKLDSNGIDEINSNTLSLSGTANFNGTSFNGSKCYSNAGTSGFALSGSSVALPVSQSWSFWVKINSFSALQFIVGNVSYRAANISFRVATNGDLLAHLEYVGDSGTVLISNISLNTWYHVCVTISSTKVMNTYLNGVFKTTFNIPTGWVSAANQILLGKYIQSSTLYNINGSVDNIRIYSKELLPLEVSKIYQIERI